MPWGDLPRGEFSGSGLLVVDKDAGVTSHDVVAAVRRLAGTRKAGHAGTLDPMATGVLCVGVGRATKLLRYVTGADKEYTATVRLGVETSTEDADGRVTAARGAAGVRVEAVDRAIAALTGVVEQVPSSVSAVKVGGRRARVVDSGLELQDGGAVTSRDGGPTSIDLDSYRALAVAAWDWADTQEARGRATALDLPDIEVAAP